MVFKNNLVSHDGTSVVVPERVRMWGLWGVFKSVFEFMGSKDLHLGLVKAVYKFLAGISKNLPIIWR